MTTTEVKMRFNLGYFKGEEEIRFVSSDIDVRGLCNHLSKIMPAAGEFGFERIAFCDVSDDPIWFYSDDNEDSTSYEMQMRFTVRHDCPLSLTAAQVITDAIYKNVGNASYTFVGPYQFKCLPIDCAEPEAAPNPKEEGSPNRG